MTAPGGAETPSGGGSRQSIMLRVVGTYGAAILQTVVGGGLLVVGLTLLVRELGEEPHDRLVLAISLGMAIFGALIIPSIFPVAQKVYILFFPSGLPWIGGGRKDDPPIGSAAARQLLAADPTTPVVIVTPPSPPKDT